MLRIEGFLIYHNRFNVREENIKLGRIPISFVLAKAINMLLKARWLIKLKQRLIFNMNETLWMLSSLKSWREVLELSFSDFPKSPAYIGEKNNHFLWKKMTWFSNINTTIFQLDLTYSALHFFWGGVGIFNKSELTMILSLIYSLMKQIMPEV